MMYLVPLICLVLLQSMSAETFEQRAARDVFVCFHQEISTLDAADFPLASEIVSIRKAAPGVSRDNDLSKVVIVEAATLGAALDICSSLKQNSNVAWAEVRPERTIDARLETRTRPEHLDSAPNDPFYSQQWYLDRIEAPAAWDIVTPDSSVVIAILDDGVHFGHPDLAAARWENALEVNGQIGIDDDNNGYVDDLYGYDFIDKDGDPTPNPVGGENSHGTHVAGIAAATRNNRLGIAGVAGGAMIMAVRVGQGGSIPYGFEGFLYAIRNGARIINCSWGGSTESAYESQIVKMALDSGCVVVVSAGNNGNSIRRYPAAINGVTSVAASGANDHRADFTNYGPWVKITAPGVYIQSCLYDGNGHTYGAWQGTSMAAPVVTGVCALVKQHNPALTGAEIQSIILNSTDPIDEVNISYEEQLGHGRVNAYRAVAETRHTFQLTGMTADETFQSDQDGRIEAGETGNLSFDYTNSLGSLENVSLYVQSEDSLIEVIFPVEPLELPLIEPNSSGHFEDVFRFRLTEQLPRGAIFPAIIEFHDSDDILRSRTSLNIILDSTFTVLGDGDIKLGIGEQGALGYFDYVRNIPLGPGLTLSGLGFSGLYHGSVFVEVGGKVIDNFYGNPEGNRFDFTALPDSYAGLIASDRADQVAQARFNDRTLPEPERLNVELNLNALHWNTVDGYLLEFTVINRSSSDWPAGICGVILDWDLAGSSRNYGGFDDANGILHARSELTNYPFVGLAGIEETLSTAYEISNRDEFPTGAGFSDQRIAELVHAGIGGFSDAPRDLSHIAALGFPTLAAGDSAQVVIALLTGHNLTQLSSNLNSLRSLYTTGELPPITKGPTPHQTLAKPVISPNPFVSGQTLSVSGVPAGDVTLKLYNILGQTVGQFATHSGPSGNVTFDAIPVLSPGLLFYQINHLGGASTGKLLYLP